MLLDYANCVLDGGPVWLPRDSDRIWTGSYKGKDWKYLVSAALFRVRVRVLLSLQRPFLTAAIGSTW